MLHLSHASAAFRCCTPRGTLQSATEEFCWYSSGVRALSCIDFIRYLFSKSVINFEMLSESSTIIQKRFGI